ncbi:hypothetical protein BDR05DRAFT_968122 [Suillus weaverae]|nr:hypothetical protein BDR05DRAFT_968122 [Suillus weaverae]
MLSQILIASAIFLRVVASDYYCDSGEAVCCTNTTTTSVKASRDILAAYSISDSGLSGLIGYGCSAIVAASDGSVSGCTNETVCCTGPQYYDGQITVNCTAAVSV